LELIVVPLVYSVVVFRRKRGDTTDAEHIEGSNTLEVTWTVIPLFAVLIFAYLGSYTLAETRRVDPNAMEIKVKGIQWAWSFEYPDGFVSKELHLPVNKQVVLRMTSSDVIHSFWVPEFRIKQDVVPGRLTEYRITPTRVGDYVVRCAELCGASHAYMESKVIVSTDADYMSWVKEQVAAAALAASTPEARGKQLAANNGCGGCHSIDGSKLPGPTWQGLFGSQVKLADGSSVVADEAYLAESIKNPAAKIVAGYENVVMPNFGLTDDQIKDIVAYIGTLK